MFGKLIAGLASLPCFALSFLLLAFSWSGPCHNPTGLSMFQMPGIPHSEKVGMGATIVVPALAGVFMLTLARRLGNG
jgi:hypothetical protein